MTLEKRKEKEQKELTRLRKINQKPETAKYIKWIFVLVILVHVIDEIASNCAAYVQSSVVNDFFVVGQGMTYENGLAVLASFSGVTLLLQLVAPFYKSLADRFGRKPFLVINTYGMALVAMVDSNLHRENLKPSEKAFAYKMKLDAMKHQGKRTAEKKH